MTPRSTVLGMLTLVAFIGAVWLWLGNGETDPKGTDKVDSFLSQHWQDPLPPQGAPPSHFSALEGSLDPAACGQCHEAQHRDWNTSLHSQTMGPGIQWQLRLMGQGEANRCLRCHAPLAEQKALVAMEHGWPNAPSAAPPAYVPERLAHDGLVCAACHVRGHERIGPVPRQPPREPQGHGGFRISPAFEDGRFCASCHQFPDDGPRLAGKLHEDTINQWRASEHAQTACQQCHMPDRRHLFRGIHDPDMVRKALDVKVDVAADGEARVASIEVRNVGAGHHFPTYMVPKVTLELDLVSADGARQRLDSRVIGWQVDVGLTRENFDTRLPSGATLAYSSRFVPPAVAGWSVELRVDVAPREHYERVFANSLAQADQFDPVTRALLQQAFDEARGTRFEALRVTAKEAGT